MSALVTDYLRSLAPSGSPTPTDDSLPSGIDPTAHTAARGASSRVRFRVLDDVTINERPTPPQRWHERLQAEGVAMIVGQTETYKTFVVLGLELASLRGVPWLGAEVLPVTSSIFVAGEGASGLKSRINAWKAAHNVLQTERLGLHVVDGAMNLFDREELLVFIEEVVLPHAPCNVTFDTQSRCSVGADENSARDMGLVLDSAYRVREAAQGSVNVVHHTNASETRERGSTVMKFGVENCLLLTKTDDVVTLSSTKNKDMDAFTPVALKLTQVVGTDSCIVRLASSVVRSTGTLSPSQEAALMALWDTFGAEGATAKEWHAALPSMVERTCFAARKALMDGGYVAQRGTRFVPQRRP
jgi:hypothetical protein